MTNEEAKFVLEKNMSVFDIRLNDAYNTAIEALETIEGLEAENEALAEYNRLLVEKIKYLEGEDEG